MSYCWLRQIAFFFNDTATTEIYTLSLHDALPILAVHGRRAARERACRRLRAHAARLSGRPARGSRRAAPGRRRLRAVRSEEHTSELQSRPYLVCRLLLEKKKH